MEFTFYNPVRIVFGAGKLAQAGELAAAWGKRPLVVTHPDVMARAGHLERLVGFLGRSGLQAEVFDAGKPNPLSSMVDHGVEAARRSARDVVIGLGGGSAIDAAKAIAVAVVHEEPAWRLVCSGDADHVDPSGGLPIIAIPTTAGTGSEVTDGAVLTNPVTREKAGIMCPYGFPKTSIIDPELMKTAPPEVTAATGLDVLFHALEAYVSKNANPVSDGYAEQALTIVGTSLRTAYRDGSNLEARTRMAWASTAGGLAICGAGVTMLHAMGHPVSGHFDATHGIAMAALFPSFFDYIWESAAEKLSRIAPLLGEQVAGLSTQDAARACRAIVLRLMSDVGVTQSLRDLGAREKDIPSLAADAMKNMGLFVELSPRSADENQLAAVFRYAMSAAGSPVG